MQTTFKSGSCVVDKLPGTTLYPVHLIQFARTLASTSHSKLEIEFREAHGTQVFSVNGREPIAYGGHSFAYCVKLLIDELPAIGYFD